jgi:ABC-2 type transport system ATP-binding protein
MISVQGLSKRFGTRLAVDGLSFEARPGVVTGFLGPNGAGKSTTMRCMLGLDRADAGEARFGGVRYVEVSKPLSVVGALLDAGYVHPGRSGRNHLRWLAAANGLAASRVDETLAMVGLTDVARRSVRTYSLGMRQRLGLAAVLLGDPPTVILDEPANGLDPEGIRWIRSMLRYLADQGRTILVSSHLLSEMALLADELVVIGQGRLIEQNTVADFVRRYADHWVRVAGPNLGPLGTALARAGAHVRPEPDGTLIVRGMAAAQVGDMAASTSTVLHELSSQQGSLEDAYLKATESAVEYRGGAL